MPWETEPPKRFRLVLSKKQEKHRPMPHGLRYGVYFPTTDLCINDMGRRSTGRPMSNEHCTVEWIDE